MRGRFLEAILYRTERELAGPGPPERLIGWWQGGAPGGAASYVTGRARLALSAARGEALLRLRGVPLAHPGASRRSTPSRGYREDRQTSDALRRENIETWLFETTNRFVAWMERGAIRDKHFSIRCPRISLRSIQATRMSLPEDDAHSLPNCRFNSTLARCSRSRWVFGSVLPARLT
jgi:hypothetical protein